MHLKNFSLIQHNGMTTLSPSYDLLNTSIILLYPDEELALPLNGKKNKLKKHDFIDYFAKEKLMLTDKVIDTLMSNFKTLQNKWEQWINISFLPFEKKQAYKEFLQSRYSRIF